MPHHNHSRRTKNLYDDEWWDFFAKPLAGVKRINDYDDLRDFVSCGVKQEISLYECSDGCMETKGEQNQ